MEKVYHAFRYAFRGLVRNPAFSIAAVLTLGMGIGLNALVYSVTRAAFLKPLPFADESRLVNISDLTADQDGKLTDFGGTPLDVMRFNSDNRTLAAMGATQQVAFGITGKGDPQTVQGGRVSAGLWDVFGTKAIAGRTFTTQEDVPGNAIVVISERYQRRHFPGRPAGAIGKTMTIDGEPRQIIGVMPMEFSPLLDNSDVWIPLGVTPSTVQDVAQFNIAMAGRMKPGVTVAQVSADLARIAKNLEQEFPTTHANWSARAVSMRESIRGNIGALAISMTLAVLFLLLLACANISNLTLARVMVRRMEVSTRLALGGSARGIIAGQVCEGVLLGLAGAALGLIVARLALRPLLALASTTDTTDAILRTSTLDASVAVATVGVSVLVGVVCAFFASWYGVRAAAQTALAGAGRRQTAGVTDRRLRRLLMSAQVGIAAVLLVASIAMVAALHRLSTAPVGFETEHLTAARLTLPATRYGDLKMRSTFVQRVMENLENTPGIAGAGMTNGRFALGNNMMTNVFIEGQVAPDGNGSGATFRRAGGRYFEIMGIQPLEGRVFQAMDRDGTIPVTIISKSFATRFFPGQSPIGRRIKRNGKTNPWMTIVGVVPDVNDAGAGVDLGPAIYVPVMQNATGAVTFVVRSALPPLAVSGALRAAVSAVDAMQPIDDINTMDRLVSMTLGQQKFKTIVLTSLSILALLLATTGVSGVTAFVIAQRTREIGLRMAIGSTRFGIARMLIGETAQWIVAGVAAGLIVGRALIMASTRLLPEVAHTDLTAYFIAASSLLGVGVIAAIVPAQKAARIPPSIALRSD